MALKTFVVCDVCGEIHREHTPRMTKTWLCPAHRDPLPRCVGCGQVTRPYTASAEKFPGTVARGRTKPEIMCSTCNARYKRNGTTDITALAEATQEQKSATLRVLEKHGALDLRDILGL